MELWTQELEEPRPLPGLWVHTTPHSGVILLRLSKGVTPSKNVLPQIVSAIAPGSALGSLALGQAESLRKNQAGAQPLPNIHKSLEDCVPGNFVQLGIHPHRMTLALGSLCVTSVIPMHLSKTLRAAKNISGVHHSTVQVKWELGLSGAWKVMRSVC